MNFSAWAIKNPVAPILGFVILLFLGLASFAQLPISRFPAIVTPVISVAIADPGKPAIDLERAIAPVLEDALRSLPDVKVVRSSLREGVASFTVEFRTSVASDEALQTVTRTVESLRNDLPSTIKAPLITTVEAMGGALLTYALFADMERGAFSRFAKDEITSRLLALPGVARVEVYGAAEPEIEVLLDPDALAARGLSIAQVTQALRAANLDLSAGQFGQTQALRVLGDVQDISALGQIDLGKGLRLGEIAQIHLTTQTPRSFARAEGRQGLGLSIFKGKDGSETEIAKRVAHELEVLAAQIPSLEIVKSESTVDFTEGNFEASMHTLYEGAALAVIVVFLFLRDWRATLIAAVALPLSAIPTFWVMDLLGFSLNLISLLGITLATGLLVDDAIVEIENIARHMRMGKPPLKAARDAADEIGLAVISTSLTIVAIFVPVSFLPGVPGQYFEQFGLTVAVAVLFSLLVARLITPLLCALFLKPSAHTPKDGWLMRAYLRLVAVSARFRYGTLILAVATLGLSIWSIIGIPGAFMPPEDQNRLILSLELPPGSSLSETESALRGVEDKLRDIDGIRDLYTIGGSSPTGATESRRAALTVLLEPVDKSFLRRASEALGLPFESDKRLRPDTEIKAEVFERLATIPDLRVTPSPDLTYSILSRSPEDLTRAIALLEEALAAEPLFARVFTDGALLRPEVQLTPRPEAQLYGLTAQSLADALRLATAGDIDALLPSLRLEGEAVPIRLRLPPEARSDWTALERLPILTPSGTTVPLRDVATLTPSASLEAISRLDGQRLATISATLASDVALGRASDRFDEIIATVDLPASVRLAPSGDAELQNEVMSSFSTALILGLLLMLAVLILLFGSVLQPLTILLSLPFSLGGVAAALHLSGSPLSMPILIGILLLFGIVTKNAILLVDFVILLRKEGLERRAAVVEAGHKRAQPILMTSIAMAAGMIPSALGVGDGGAFRAPMALAVIGGILSSTVLSLVLVPALYLVMDDLSRLVRRRA